MRNGEILCTREGAWNLSVSFERSAELKVQKLIEERCETGKPDVGIVACIRMRTLLNAPFQICSLMPKRDSDIFWHWSGKG